MEEGHLTIRIRSWRHVRAISFDPLAVEFLDGFGLGSLGARYCAREILSGDVGAKVKTRSG